jgi:hypothetical protein
MSIILPSVFSTFAAEAPPPEISLARIVGSVKILLRTVDLVGRQLSNIIENDRRKGATDSSVYVDALAEQARRKGKDLDFDNSFGVIWRAAAEDRFISYKELAHASGADWNQVHYSIGGHLWSLVEYAYRKGWPMLSAVVVNKQNVASGKMEQETLKGFIAAARKLGFSITDEEVFLREQQRRVFEWAKPMGGSAGRNTRLP